MGHGERSISKSDPFREAFERLRSVGPELFFEQLYAFFRGINAMNPDELVAFYQAAKMYAAARGMGETNEPYASVVEAVILQMARLAMQGVIETQDVDAYHYFSAVVGHERFEKAARKFSLMPSRRL